MVSKVVTQAGRTNQETASWSGTLADAKSIIDSQTSQLTALEARISPLEQVIAARDQELRDLKAQIIKQSELQRLLDRQKVINEELARKNEQLTNDLGYIRAIVKGWTVEAKMIRALIKDHA